MTTEAKRAFEIKEQAEAMLLHKLDKIQLQDVCRMIITAKRIISIDKRHSS